jgi:transposase-like protein
MNSEIVMQKTHNQDCPLCSGSAEFQFIDYENRKHFRCKNCTEFVISVRAEEKLKNSMQQWRQKYAEMAKISDEETILVITIPFVVKKEGIANPAIQGEFVLRSTLRL